MGRALLNPPDECCPLPTQGHWLHRSTPSPISNSGFIPSCQLPGLLVTVRLPYNKASWAALPSPSESHSWSFYEETFYPHPAL